MHMKLVMICALFISMIISIYVVFHPQLKESKLFIDRLPAQSILNFLTNEFAIFTTPLLFFIIIFFLFVGILEILPIKLNLENQANATLLATIFAGSITLISIVVTALLKYYSKKQDRIVKIRSEMNWRNKLIKIETKPSLTINDMLKLNSFINPYHKEKNIDYFINKVCTHVVKDHLLKHYPNNSKIKRDLKEFQEIKKETNEYTGMLPPEAVKMHDETIFDLRIDDIIHEKLDSNESQVIRECAHALLKNDWELNVK